MLWGSRFDKELEKFAFEFSKSINFDIKLFEEDIQVSIVHSQMLAEKSIISNNDFEKIKNGLIAVKAELKDISLDEIQNFEDIHSLIESRLKDKIGETANKLHSGRSRNDLVSTSLKMWTRKALNSLLNDIEKFQKTLVSKASKHVKTVIPGYTHLQRAQPVSLALHLLAYVEMLERDKKRIKNALEEIDTCPLGSGALAGSTLDLDREMTAKLLNFSKPTKNALDSVSDRDFVLETLNTVNIGMMHLSRFSEELILWASSEFNFAKIGDDFTTGSSLMPQKKNPDIAELIRGKCGRAIGNYMSLITVMKGLPLSYNKDMQEDKEPLFDSIETYSNSLKIFSLMVDSTEFNKGRFEKELDGDFSLATDLTDWLVKNGTAFREAHFIVGQVVKFAEEKGKKLNELTIAELQSISGMFNEESLDCTKIQNVLERKKTYGSPNPNLVEKQIEKWMEKLKSN